MFVGQFNDYLHLKIVRNEFCPDLMKIGYFNHPSSFYYIPFYRTDMEQVSNIMQCIKHLFNGTIIFLCLF